MNNSELSKYILHYIREDCTRSAIMLTADWGTGKSYYIQNELIPFLGKEENGCCTCIVVSLYGLKSVEEISKSLYLESRMKFLAKNSEGIATGKFAVRTILVTSLRCLSLIPMIRLITMPIWAVKAIMGLTAIWIPHWSVDGGHLTAVHSNLTIMG